MPDQNVIKQVENRLGQINTELHQSIQAVNEEVEKHGKIGAKNAARLDNLSGSIEEVTARVLELEQAGTQQNDIDNAIKSVGAQFTDSEAFENFRDGSNTKAAFTVENNAVVGSDATVAPDRRQGIVGGAMRKLRVLDAIPKGTTTSNSIEYTRENVFTNNAAETAEGAANAYPETDITFELVTAPVRNIGHFIYVSKQMLEDSQSVTSYIDGRLIYGVEYRKDRQAIIGNGAGQNLSGLFNTGNYIPLAGATAGDKQYKNVRRAIAQVEAADYSATAIFLNPADCADIDLITGSDDHFVSANPRVQSIKTLWGLPVIETNAMTVGSFLVGSLEMSAQFTERRSTIVEISDSDNDNFTKDMVTLKATARAALEIYRPASMVGGLLVTP